MPSSQLKVTLLGTGTSQGVPVIGCHCDTCQSDDERDKRLRVSVIIESETTTVAIDAGPDFRAQHLRHGTDRLDAVFITHEHNDHMIGLDDVRPFNFKQQVDMPIYALPRVIDEVKLRFGYVFKVDAYPGLPRFELKPIRANDTIPIGDLKVQAIPVMHGRLPILGYRIENFAYITDVSYLSDEAIDDLQELEVLVLGALHYHSHHSHFTIPEAIEWATRIGAQQTYLTHLSHYAGKHADIEKTLPQGISLAYDGCAWMLDE